MPGSSARQELNLRHTQGFTSKTRGEAHAVLQLFQLTQRPQQPLPFCTIFFFEGGADILMPDFAQNIHRHSSRNMFSIWYQATPLQPPLPGTDPKPHAASGMLSSPSRDGHRSHVHEGYRSPEELLARQRAAVSLYCPVRASSSYNQDRQV